MFKPDGFARLRRDHAAGEEALCFFLEVDMGSAAHEKIWAKWLMHRQYLQSGLFQDTYGSGRFHTLLLTSSSERVDNLLALFRERVGEDACRDIFLFTTFAAVEEKGILGPIWQSTGNRRHLGLLEALAGAS